MIEVYCVSAFSKNNSGGNLAGIVLNSPNIDLSQKIKMAGIVGYSETVFIFSGNGADFRFEYFTPEGEVPVCGHATIAAFSLMHNLKMLDKSDYKIETGAGILNISIASDGLVFMEQNKPKYFDILNKNIFDNCLDVSKIKDSMPIQIVSTGLRDIVLPVKTMEDLADLTIDFNEMAKISKKYNTIGVHAFALSNDKDITAICRNFAPLYGINEESATGTANCALSCYLFKYGIKRQKYIYEQGYNLNSISEINVLLDYDKNIINSVKVGGYGYTVGKKNISIQF